MGETAGVADDFSFQSSGGKTGNTGPDAALIRASGSRPMLTARSLTAWHEGLDDSYDAVHYGPGIATEADLRLLGNVADKRVLELGCGAGAAAIALAKQGARVVAVDESAAQIGHARRAADNQGARLELRHGDLADLAFLRADTIDAALSVYTLGTVDDLDRVFRQVHRVLRPEAPLAISLPHPAFRTIDQASDPPALARSYFDRTPLPWPSTAPSAASSTASSIGPSGIGAGDEGAEEGADYTRSIADIFTSLTRANFRVDVVLEPEPRPGARRDPRWTPAMAWIPATLIVRARKQGI